jgi:hypothetical protein
MTRSNPAGQRLPGPTSGKKTELSILNGKIRFLYCVFPGIGEKLIFYEQTNDGAYVRSILLVEMMLGSA